jgi:putative PEP-CTERM system histidine kinase
MSLTGAIYASCSASFLALIGLMLLRGRISGPGLAIIAACGLTALWAANLAVPGLLPNGASAVLDSLRLSVWLILMVALVGLRNSGRGSGSLPLLAAIGFSAVVVGCDVAIVIGDPLGGGINGRLHDFLHVGFSVGGLLAAENLLRNADMSRRRNLLPLCVALGAIFAFELFLYADRLIVPGSNPILAGGRGLIGLFAVPLLALAMARNREWHVDIHVSRAVVFHTAALVASGAFFLVLAVVGILVRELGGSWGPKLQVLSLLGSAVVLVSVLGSRNMRIRLKQLIARHFFSHRFDYRTEWLRFVSTVSQPETADGDLSVRVVRALAQIVDSRAGTLWCLREGIGYAPEVGWNLAPERGEILSLEGTFVAGFQAGEWIQKRPADGQGDWPFASPKSWLAIPLTHGKSMIAFVVLDFPTRSYALDGETFDLLRAAARQAASYLAEEQATRALLDSRLLNDYSKRFAFVVHDMKNVASQLGLVVRNAARYLDDPEFRQDMLYTLENSVAKLNQLVARLHAGDRDVTPKLIEPDAVIAKLASELSALGTPVEIRLDAGDCMVAINSDEFRSVLCHLINNAREAVKSEEVVTVASYRTQEKVTIDIVDSGPGMDDDFIRDQLFRPFRSTKGGGLGIGVYQTRELLRMSGGELDVISKKGIGTVMRITLPVRAYADLTQSAA